MQSKKTGVSVSGIVDTNKVKPIECDCRQCFHATTRKGFLYCSYYSMVEPKKKKCARYYRVNRGGKQKRPLTKEQKEQWEKNKKKSFPWEIG